MFVFCAHKAISDVVVAAAAANLEDALADDVAPHLLGDEEVVPAVGLAVQQVLCWRLCGKRQRSHSVHDQVHPQKLATTNKKCSWRLRKLMQARCPARIVAIKGKRCVVSRCVVSRSYLDWRENALSRCDSRDEGDDEGDQVDGQLELQEFSYRIVYVSAPHDSSNDGSKVVI